MDREAGAVMARYFLDTEFLEQPCTIDLISIGIVREDGREFYAISSEYDRRRAEAHPFVSTEVLPNLDAEAVPPITRREIAEGIKRFAPPEERPEFWAYFADYDWVAFCWLFGPMVDLPIGYPFFCRDLKQLAEASDVPSSELRARVPKESDRHNALDDARFNRRIYEYLTNVPGEGTESDEG